jgi:hypothetical protein
MKKIIGISITLLLVFVFGYTYWFYYNPYSDGYREGLLQKFSRKGNVLKTFEGEMLLAGFGPRTGSIINSNYFYFSVADKPLADSLDKCLGKVVKLHYVQYRRSLPWRGEDYGIKNADKGQYVVDNISDVKDAVLY